MPRAHVMMVRHYLSMACTVKPRLTTSVLKARRHVTATERKRKGGRVVEGTYRSNRYNLKGRGVLVSKKSHPTRENGTVDLSWQRRGIGGVVS